MKRGPFGRIVEIVLPNAVSCIRVPLSASGLSGARMSSTNSVKSYLTIDAEVSIFLGYTSLERKKEKLLVRQR